MFELPRKNVPNSIAIKVVDKEVLESLRKEIRNVDLDLDLIWEIFQLHMRERHPLEKTTFYCEETDFIPFVLKSS